MLAKDVLRILGITSPTLRNYAEIIATLDRTIIIENIDIFPQKRSNNLCTVP